ncbi:putative trehalose operon repressor [Coriobacteriaceae bacterium BV3Ac1]|nr:putative trehalose operon repressor [Coriobacteriaceae bacterium BV3Ac1]
MRAAYDAIYRELKEAILEGEYPYQSMLPSEAVLVERYRCAHNTVRRALGMLAAQGMVQPIHGKGVRVIWMSHERATFEVGGIETFAEIAARNNFHAVTRTIVFEEIEVDEEFVEASGFAKGMKLLHLLRVRELDGRALILDKNYFRADAVKGLTREQSQQSIYAYVEDKLGNKIATSNRLVTAERATREDRRLLDIADVDFLAVVTSQTFDGNGEPFEYTQSRHHPDFFAFRDIATRNTI